MTTQQLQLKLQKQAQLQQCLNQQGSSATHGTATVATVGSVSGGSAVAAALQGKHRRRSATGDGSK